jgi:hypothetical protein
MSTDIDPEGLEPAPEEAPPDYGPWSQWQQAGIDPAYNPYDARKALNLSNALSKPEHRDYALEQVLRGHELPEDMTWQEAREAIRNAAEARNRDPWDDLLQQQEPEGDLIGYAADGSPVYAQPPGQYQQPQHAGLNPEQIREAVKAEIARNRQEWEAQQRAAEQERQQGEEFDRAISSIKTSEGLGDADLRWLIPATIANLQGPMAGAPMAEAAKHTWAEMKAWRNQAAAEAAVAQQNVPQTRTPTGPSPAANQTPANLREAGERARDFFTG